VATEVRSTKNGRKRTMSIDYVLHENDNAWRVFDLVTDGVGLVQNYRSQFNKVIAKEGIAGLLERMRKKSLEAKQ
jgi:phospholipid transport system substrate-binding protein